MAGFWSSETMRERLEGLIEPFDRARIKNCAYELSMGGEACITDSKKRRSRIRLKLDKGQYTVIPPGQLAQLLVDETVEIPQDSLGLISMKSSFKMRGLVNVSGFHVDPGYKGKLVFAVFNAGSREIVIKQGEPAFLLWLTSLDRYTTDEYAGSRQGKSEITSDQYMNLRGPTYNPTTLADRVSQLEFRYKAWRNVGLAVVVAIVLAILGVVSDVVSFDFSAFLGESGTPMVTSNGR